MKICQIVGHQRARLPRAVHFEGCFGTSLVRERGCVGSAIGPQGQRGAASPDPVSSEGLLTSTDISHGNFETCLRDVYDHNPDPTVGQETPTDPLQNSDPASKGLLRVFGEL